MANTVTQVTQVGFFSKLMESIKGVVAGLAIFLIAFPVLFFNECHSVNEAKKLASGRDNVVEIATARVDPANEGALVAFTGEASTPDTLRDANFGVALSAIKLMRTVEQYQWQEDKRTTTRQKAGGGEEKVTTYSYDKTWSSEVLTSADFHEPAGHQNPGSMAYESTETIAQNVTVGDFTLSPDLVGQMSHYAPLEVTDAMIATLPESLRDRVVVSGGRYYFGASPTAPVVGDLRVAFQTVQPAQVSVVTQQRGTGTQAWSDPDGRGTIAMLAYGAKSADEMFTTAEQANQMLTWILRFVGYLMMFAGLSAVLRPFAVMAGVVPIFGRAVSLFASLIAGVIAALLWCITVGLAWFAVRPILAIVLFVVAAVAAVVAIVLAGLLFKAVRSARAAPAAA